MYTPQYGRYPVAVRARAVHRYPWTVALRGLAQGLAGEPVEYKELAVGASTSTYAAASVVRCLRAAW